MSADAAKHRTSPEAYRRMGDAAIGCGQRLTVRTITIMPGSIKDAVAKVDAGRLEADRLG